MFLQSEFVFLDYEESKLLFFLDYLALMGLCIFIAHYSAKLVHRFLNNGINYLPNDDGNSRRGQGVREL